MTGKLRAAVYLTLVLALSFLVVSLSNRDVDATTWQAIYITTQGGSDADVPGGNPDTSAIYNQPGPNANFGRIDNVAAPVTFDLAADADIVDGLAVGGIRSQTTLGLLNQACATPIIVVTPFMEATTDINNTADFIGTGENLILDDPGGDPTLFDNGVPTYADHYPSFLNTLFTSPITGDPVKPLARYVGHTQVLAGAPPTLLNFVIFAPGDLGDPNTGVGLPEATMEESFGYVLRVVLNNEAAAAAPSTITDFCTTLSTVTTLTGVTVGEMIVMPGPSPFEVEGSVAQCGAASGTSNALVNPDGGDDDGDGFNDDGCLRIPDPCGGVDYDGDTTVTLADGEDPLPATNDDGDGTTDEGCFGTSSDASGAVRLTNPAAGTGVYGTGTHISRSYSSGIRDADGDGLDNGLDPCQTIATTNTDADFDGLDDAPGCDPNTGVGSTTAQSPNGIDDDGDTVIDEDPVNNADDDGDTQLDEDGECEGVSGLPDEDQDCYANRLDNCALIPNDQSDLDEDPEAADAGTPGDGIGDACESGADAPVGESGGQCGNNLDEDGDNLVNDGCPTVTVGSCPGAPPPVGTCQDRPEVGAECGEKPGAALDDDGDGTINDGCPAAGGGISNGHYHSNSPLAYSCIAVGNGPDDTNSNNDPDDDDDGVCDSTEELLGSCPRDTCDSGDFPNLSDLNGDTNIDAADSTPEYEGLVYSALPADQDGDTVIDQSPSICTDLTIYPGGTAIDNDGDGDANGADSGCSTAPVVGVEDGAGPGSCHDGIDNGDNDGADEADASFDCADFDKDGIANAADNCPYLRNPEQSRRILATPAGDDCEGIDEDGDFDGDTVTDADDTDRDGDGLLNNNEPVTDPYNPDTDGDGVSDGPSDPDGGGPIGAGPDNCPNTANPGQENNVHTGTPAGDHCEDPDGDLVFDIDDTCPDLANAGAGQTDTDADGLGDVCDSDDDGDGYFDSDETAKGSNTLDAGSTPEHCDGTDNDGDTVVDEAPVGSGRATPDPQCDPLADTDGDTILNGTDLDDDGDGVSDAFERSMSTDELAPCSTNLSHDAVPSDFDHNTSVNPGDILGLFFFSIGESAGDPFYSRRADFDGNGINNPGDILGFFFFFIGTSCSP